MDVVARGQFGFAIRTWVQAMRLALQTSMLSCTLPRGLRIDLYGPHNGPQWLIELCASPLLSRSDPVTVRAHKLTLGDFV